MTDFDNLHTVAELDRTFKRLYAEQGCYTDRVAEWNLREEHRRAHERIALDRRKTERLEQATADSDPNHIRPFLLRNWAAEQGIPLAVKGKVPRAVEDAYREAHGLVLST